MKYLLYFLALGIGIAIGFWRNITEAQKLRMISTIVVMTIGLIAAFYPPIVGTFTDVFVEAKGKKIAQMNVLLREGGIIKSSDNTIICVDIAGDSQSINVAHHLLPRASKSKEIARLEIVDGTLVLSSIHPAPSLILPYIPGLGERARIMFVHVPLAWTGFFAYFITMLFSIRYLITYNALNDTIANSSAFVGTILTSLAYVTGAIWAKFNWGKFFNWDTRELSVLLLLAIYAAYFTLRTNIRNEPLRNKISAIYAIIAAVASVFLIFIVPRVTTSLHPGSQGDGNIGPVLSPNLYDLDTTKTIIFSIMLCAFTLLYTWFLNVLTRIEIVRQRLSDV